MLESLQIIAFTHKNSSIENIGLLHLSEESQREILPSIKSTFFFHEFMYLSTCNRVELILRSDEIITREKLVSVLTTIQPTVELNKIKELANSALLFNGTNAVQHLFKVASSLDSLVIGEREIITQVRKSYELSHELGLTGDLIRLLVKQTIETAKEIYTNTGISKNPVSVVSLAYRQLRQLNIKNDARVLIIGAGETNTNLCKYLKKHKFANFVVFNRTESKAKKLATELGGISYPLTALKNYIKGFDVLITCTSSQEPIVTKAIYEQLLVGEQSKKVIIDLAVPNDIDREILTVFDVKLIAVETLETALNNVFAKDINSLDTQSREVLDKVISYFEKKYNAVAMKTAKEAFLKENELN